MSHQRTRFSPDPEAELSSGQGPSSLPSPALQAGLGKLNLAL